MSKRTSKYWVLGLALFGLSLATLTTSNTGEAQATSRLKTLRTEVANLSNRVTELNETAEVKKQSSATKASESERLKKGYEDGAGEFEKLEAQYKAAESSNKDQLEQIRKESKAAEDLIKKAEKTKKEANYRVSRLEQDFVGTKLGEARDLEDWLKNLGELTQGEDSKFLELETRFVSLALQSEAKKASAKELQERFDLDDNFNKLEQEFEKKSEERKKLIDDSERLKKESDQDAKDSEAALNEAEETRSQLRKKQAELDTVVANLYKEALNDPNTDFNGEEDQALIERVRNKGRQSGLTSHTGLMANFLTEKFGVSSVGGWRADDDGTGHGHNSGMAIDLMVDDATGDKIAKYVANNFSELGIYYVIWEQKYLMNQSNIYGPAGVWSMMPDRGSATANHYDHVHISFAK